MSSLMAFTMDRLLSRYHHSWILVRPWTIWSTIRPEPKTERILGHLDNYHGPYVGQPRRITWFAVLMILMIVSACSGGQPEGPTLGSEQTLSGPATLVCGPACSERAQCGLADQRQTVLLSSSGPATSNFDMAVVEGTEVMIIQQQMEPVVQVSDQTSERLPFYQVDIVDVGAGWVAGWCISQ